MLDLAAVHALARRRRPRLAVEAALREAADTARAEGLAGEVDVVDRLEALTRWHHGDVGGVVVDQRQPEEGRYGWVMLLGTGTLREDADAPPGLVLVAEPETVTPAARLLARLAVEPRAVTVLGGDPAAARQAGLTVKPLEEGERLPLNVTLAYGRSQGQAGVVEQLLWRGGNPLAIVRLDAERPLVVATGDPVEAMAFAAALAVDGA